MREHPDEVDRARLHVVFQKGRLFQREHPDVPVLLDKGRFLLVDLDPKRVRKIGKSDVPCFAVRPLDALKTTRARRRERVVFEPATRAPASAPDPAIKALVNRISRQSYEATWPSWSDSRPATRSRRNMGRPATSPISNSGGSATPHRGRQFK